MGAVASGGAVVLNEDVVRYLPRGSDAVEQVKARELQELARRDIALAEVEVVLAAPGQIVPEHGGIVCYQSQTTCDRKPCLLRVMVNEAGEPKVVVTIYRTSKISKYWQM